MQTILGCICSQFTIETRTRTRTPQIRIILFVAVFFLRAKTDILLSRVGFYQFFFFFVNQRDCKIKMIFTYIRRILSQHKSEEDFLSESLEKPTNNSCFLRLQFVRFVVTKIRFIFIFVLFFFLPINVVAGTWYNVIFHFCIWFTTEITRNNQ